MSFDWKEYHQLAEHLANGGTHPLPAEAAQRSAVSRAYYAAFCHARNYAERHIPPNFVRSKKRPLAQRGNDHMELPEFYLKCDRRGIADPLVRLRDLRNLCDYEDDVKNLLVVVTQSLRRSRAVLDSLPPPPPPSPSAVETAP